MLINTQTVTANNIFDGASVLVWIYGIISSLQTAGTAYLSDADVLGRMWTDSSVSQTSVSDRCCLASESMEERAYICWLFGHLYRSELEIT